jgi:hypothetical protein
VPATEEVEEVQPVEPVQVGLERLAVPVDELD